MCLMICILSRFVGFPGTFFLPQMWVDGVIKKEKNSRSIVSFQDSINGDLTVMVVMVDFSFWAQLAFWLSKAGQFALHYESGWTFDLNQLSEISDIKYQLLLFLQSGAHIQVWPAFKLWMVCICSNLSLNLSVLYHHMNTCCRIYQDMWELVDGHMMKLHNDVLKNIYDRSYTCQAECLVKVMEESCHLYLLPRRTAIWL